MRPTALCPVPARCVLLAALLTALPVGATGWCASAPAHRLTMGRVTVKPLFLVPNDAQSLPGQYPALLDRHLKWAQERYRELLWNRDTFTIVPGGIQVYPGKWSTAEYLGDRGSAESVLLEIMARDGVDRFSCPFIYLVLYVGTGTAPAGGGRPINGLINTGGGIVIIGADNLAMSPNFQSTLQHELGHAFGLVHVDEIGYDMTSNPSLMSYNPKHHTKGLEPSATPGILIPEDYRLLALNHRVFPKLTVDPAKDYPTGYTLHDTVMMLGSMKLPGQPDYAGPWNGVEAGQ